MKKIFCFTLFSLSFSAFSLVDYSAPVAEDSPAQASPVKNRPASISNLSRVDSSSADTSQKVFSLNSGFETLEVPYKNKNNKVSIYSIGGHFQTPYNIFLDASYWSAGVRNSTISSRNHEQWGNPALKLGFNWLKFGAAQDLSTVDFYAGAMLPGQKKSDFASTRTDKFLGVEITKRFYDFALQLGYEMRVVGTPQTEKETAVGNIQKLSAALGWKVSSDIRFGVEGILYKLASNHLEKPNTALSKDLEFAYVSPKMILTLASFVDLELGALYQTRKIEIKDDVIEARLWDVKGLYGNSLFANLSFSL